MKVENILDKNWKDLFESNSLEIVSGQADPENVGKSVCALANAGGGTILVGVSEKGDAVGVTQAKDYSSFLRKHLAQNLSPSLPVSITFFQIEKKDLLSIDIPQGIDRPYTWKKQIYVRRENQTIEADRNVLKDLITGIKKFHWERQPAIGIEESDLEREEIRKSFNEAKSHYLLTEGTSFNLFETLQMFHLSVGGQICNGALVLFGKHPANRFPQIRIRAVCYGDTEDDNLIDNRVLEGHAFALVDQIMEFLQRHTSISSKIPDNRLIRNEKTEYPFPALREAVLNAVQHRDYEAFDGGISVVIRPYSIEIWNSGSLPAGMSVDDLMKEHHSRPNNPDIAHVFFLRGYVERIGSGAGRMIKWCRNAGLPDPEWRQDSGGISVTLRKTGELQGLNDRQKLLLKDMKPDDILTTSEFKEKFSVSERQARNDLADLVKVGLLRRTGSGPATHYVRTKKETI